MRAAAALTFAAAVGPVAACSQPAPAGATDQPAWNGNYFPQLAERLGRVQQAQAGDFASDLELGYDVCLPSYIGEQGCRAGSIVANDYAIAFSQCKPLDLPNGHRNLELCETVVERRRDKARIGCARVTGWLPGLHGWFKSSDVPMHFDAAGNWTLGPGPNPGGADARTRVATDRQTATEEPGAVILPFPSTNLHCQSDPKTFFRI